MGAVDPSGKDGLATTIGRVADGEVESIPEIFARLYRELHHVAERLLHVHGPG